MKIYFFLLQKATTNNKIHLGSQAVSEKELKFIQRVQVVMFQRLCNQMLDACSQSILPLAWRLSIIAQPCRSSFGFIPRNLLGDKISQHQG